MYVSLVLLVRSLLVMPMKSFVALCAFPLIVAGSPVAPGSVFGVCETSVRLGDLAKSDAAATIEEWSQKVLRCKKALPLESLASATYAPSMNLTGWDVFTATVTDANQAEEPVLSAASAGFLEGTLMAQRISDFLSNQMSAFIVDGVVDVDQVEALFNWERKQEAWVASQLAEAAIFNVENPALWAAVEILYAQLGGMGFGLESSGVDLYGLSGWRAAMSINLMGEYFDVMAAIDPSKRPQWRNMSLTESTMEMIKNDHCSAFISMGNYNAELFTGHNMWWSFGALMPVFKTFVWGNATIQMTSYPGTLSSVDDFYSMSSSHQKLVVMETTNNIFRTELYDLLKPESLWTWVRVMAANRLTTSGLEWIGMFSKYNSGTYNSMWMVVDYKRFTPFASVLPNSGLLSVAEQMPGLIVSNDESERLSFGLFPSYNQAYFEETQLYSGSHANDVYWRETYNITSQNYQGYNRAFLFREYGHLAQTLDGGKKLLRWNKFQSDPVTVNNPDSYTASVPAVLGALASRGDLNPGTAPGVIDSVATNAVLVSMALIDNGGVVAVGGPTHDDQEVFKWSTAPAVIQEVAHKGTPDAWDFDWATFNVG